MKGVGVEDYPGGTEIVIMFRHQGGIFDD